MRTLANALVFFSCVMACMAQPKVIPIKDKVHVSKERMERFLIKRIDPVYPASAKAQHIEGTVTVFLETDEQGNVAIARKISGPDILAAAAVDAVKQWKFQPFKRNGAPLKMVTEADVRFALVDR